MTEIKTEAERAERAEGFERDIRIAIYNAGRRRGMGQDPLFSLIQRAMDEPTMKRALAALSLQDELVDALEGLVRLSEMGLEASLREPEENGNYAAYTRARSLLTRIKSERDGI